MKSCFFNKISKIDKPLANQLAKNVDIGARFKNHG